MSFILNAAPISYEGTKIPVELFPFSDEKLQELRDEYTKSHLIKRRGDQILAVPLKTDEPPLGGQLAQIDLQQDLSLAKALASNAIYRALYEKNCWISSLTPLSYMVNRNNLLDGCFPSDTPQLKGLAVYLKYELDFRVIDPKSDAPFIAISVNVGTTPRITLNCQELMVNGISVVGHYIGKPYYGKNPELKPRFSVIGRVISVNTEGYFELEDVREGEQSIVDPIEVYLEPREDLLDYCIRCIYREKASAILINLDRKLSQFHVGNEKYKKLAKALAGYKQFNLELIEGVGLKIGDFLTEAPPDERGIKVMSSEKPLFVFSHGASKTNVYNDFGLQNYGPFSRETFSPNKPRICVVYQSNKKGQVEQVLSKFLNGLPPVPFGKNGKTFEFTGLKNKFQLSDCTLEFFSSPDNSISGYNKAIGDALQSSGAGKPYDCALIQIDADFRERSPLNNPYLAAKSRFIGQQIPVQEFTLENLGQADNRIVWSLNNMALATYAKMGGVPWLLTSDGTIAHEVVFGIGSAMIYSSRLGAKQRMIGITTVFTGDGRYHVNNISSAVLAEDYFETLLSSLRTTMERIKTDFAWRPKDSVRLIFHAFKTFKNTEAEAVKKVMSELGDFNVEFAFVHVASNSPFLLFDTNQSGFFGKGVFAPERTKFLQLSEHTALVCLTGPIELKKPTDGLPQPLQLILHRDSTFKDMEYLSKQVIKFGAHSWRSFQPAPMPVSVYYSQLMAQMLGQLSSVGTWNADAIYNKIGSTRWFL